MGVKRLYAMIIGDMTDDGCLFYAKRFSFCEGPVSTSFLFDYPMATLCFWIIAFLFYFK